LGQTLPVGPVLPTPRGPLHTVSDRDRAAVQYVAKGQKLTSVDLFGQRLRHLEACSIKSCATELIVLPLKVRIPTGAGDAARLAQLAVFGNSLMKN
jgi:hypothetical protein